MCRTWWAGTCKLSTYKQTKDNQKHNESENRRTRGEIKNQHDISIEAKKIANYNERYSRKNNVKVMNIKQEAEESESSLIKAAGDVLKPFGTTSKRKDVIAIHRIPGKRR